MHKLPPTRDFLVHHHLASTARAARLSLARRTAANARSAATQAVDRGRGGRGRTADARPTSSPRQPRVGGGGSGSSSDGAGDLARPSKARSRGPVGASEGKGDGPLLLSDTELLRWERDGFILTRGCLAAPEVERLQPEVEAIVASRKLDALRHRVRVLCQGADPGRAATCEDALRLIERRGTDSLGFLQFFHLHRASDVVRRVATGPRLAGVAAQLLGARRVRLFQDAVFLKEPGYDVTNWHSDLRMTPLDTNGYVTAWVPLRAVRGDASDSGLEFAVGSHRDFALPFWHDLRRMGDLEARGYRVRGTGPMAVGDVSWHHGWTLHCAGAQPARSEPRLAIAVSYVADGARLLDASGDASVRREMLHDEDAEGYGAWLSELKGGAPARHSLLPIVWDGGPVPG